MGKKLRVVHVGCGGISAEWLRHPFIKERVDILAFVDINPENARKRANEFGFPEAEVSTDLEAMLDKHHPDAVFDTTIPAAHKSVTLAALAHGCHVLGEKPMADTLENGKEMVAAAKRAGKVYAVTQTRRYNRNLQRLVKFIRSGAIGKVETVQSDFFIGAHFGGFRDAMRHVLILDMAIHTFDAARLISGENPESVICEDWNPNSSWYAHGASAMAFFRMTNNVRYLYHGSWCAEGLNESWEAVWRVIGSKGSVTWDGNEKIVAEVLAPNPGDGFIRDHVMVEVPPCTPDLKDGAHAGIIADFLDCMEAGKVPETVCTDNIHSLAMVCAAIDSAERDGARVAIRAE